MPLPHTSHIRNLPLWLLPKVLMPHSLNRRNSFRRIQRQHAFDEIHGIGGGQPFRKAAFETIRDGLFGADELVPW